MAKSSGVMLECNELPPSLNTMLRQHWAVRKVRRDYYAALFRCAHFNGTQIHEPVEITVTWRVMKLMDDDNAKARFKLLGDALVQAGLLTDDNPAVIKALNVKQQCVHHRNEQGFTIEIQEFRDPATVAKWQDALASQYWHAEAVASVKLDKPHSTHYEGCGCKRQKQGGKVVK